MDNKRGFTLVEALCVGCIILILSAISMTFLSGYWMKERFKSSKYKKWGETKVNDPQSDHQYRLLGYTQEEIDQLRKDPRSTPYAEMIQRDKERNDRRIERQRETEFGILNPDR